jgi:DNA-binding response OmpR family regulator
MEAQTQKRRVLVVDDEPDVCELLRRILIDIGFEVEAAEDGGPAIERLNAARWDLVILDLMMPLEGWAVLDHIRAMPARPPVVLLTARGDYESLARGLRESIAAYVIKPFEIPSLVQTCRRVVAEAEAPPRSPERRQALRRAVVAEVLAYEASGAAARW